MKNESWSSVVAFLDDDPVEFGAVPTSVLESVLAEPESDEHEIEEKEDR